jgi:gliding motility-associated-like protein
MKFLEKILFGVLTFCFSITATAQFITVDDTQTPKQLVEDVLINSSCVAVSNIVATGDNYRTGKNSYGYFTKGTSNFPFTDGIILNTSTSKNAIGPPDNNNGKEDSELWLGDSDLENVLGIKTVNSTSIEFDFVTLTNFLSFNYFFASKEYTGPYPCIYSDGFAFLIKEKGSSEPYQNLAIIPGTTTPVSSLNIHKKIPDYTDKENKFYPGCPEINLKYYDGDNNATSPINYFGQTKILTAQTTVTIGKTYHVKLVIADAKDPQLDSAVFLQAGSFDPKIDLGQDRTIDKNPVCFGETVILDPKLDPTLTYKWFRDNALLPETTSTYAAKQPGKYKVEVSLSSASCFAKGEINLEFTPEIVLNSIALIQCDDDTDGKTIFDLSKIEKIIKTNNANISSVTYYESLADAKLPTKAIVNSTNFNNTSANQTLYTRVENSYGCIKYGQINLQIAKNTIASQKPIATCDLDDKQDGLYQFDLKTQVTPQLLIGLPTGLLVEYYLNINDALLQKNQQNTIFKNTIPKQQIIYARIVNGPDCFAITPETLIVNTFDPPNFEEAKSYLCNGASIDLEVALGFSSYTWTTGEINKNKITVSKPGDYFVKVTDENGCEKTKKFLVKPSGIATITNAIVTDFSGNENTILFEFTGSGDYEFSLDGNSYENNPLKNVAPGKYFATASDKNGCGVSDPFEVYVLDYPRFFTPNGDGVNDLWKIKNLDLFPKFTITIFDRYGKLLKQLAVNNISWDGSNFPSGDYWFNLEFNNRIIKGHFSLKR